MPNDLTPEEEAIIRSATVSRWEEGLTYDKSSKAQQEMIERVMHTPDTIYDDPLPWKGWQLVYEQLDRCVRKCQITELYAAYNIAREWAKKLWRNKIKGLSPEQAMKDLHDMQIVMSGQVNPTIQRVFQEALYMVINNHYMGRKVG